MPDRKVSTADKIRLLTRMGLDAKNRRITGDVAKRELSQIARRLLELSKECGFSIEVHASGQHEHEVFRTSIIMVKQGVDIVWSSTVKPEADEAEWRSIKEA